MTDPCELSAVEARRLIGEGALSPVELFDACQKRIEEINPAVNAVVAERFEAARRGASRGSGGVEGRAARGPSRFTDRCEGRERSRWFALDIRLADIQRQYAR